MLQHHISAAVGHNRTSWPIFSPTPGLTCGLPTLNLWLYKVTQAASPQFESIGRMPMPTSDDEILVRETGEVIIREANELGGARLASIASIPAFAARLAAKFLPIETYAETLALKIAPEEALKLGFSVLTKLGKLEAKDDIKPSCPKLKAIVGSGFLLMNPGIVRLEILGGGSGGCELRISAAAKEPLIKQHTASKAVERVVSELRERAART